MDANTLLPPRLSDVLFDLCLEGLFFARWTAEIESEFIRNWPRVVARFGRNSLDDTAVEQLALDVAHGKAEFRLNCYRRAAPKYEVGVQDTASALTRVPKAVVADDKHVAAAALALLHYTKELSPADQVYIVSSNLKDLGVVDMKRLGVFVLTPGQFIDSLTDADNVRVGASLEKTVNSLRNPPYTRARLLDALVLHGAKDTAAHFARAWGEKLSTRP